MQYRSRKWLGLLLAMLMLVSLLPVAALATDGDQPLDEIVGEEIVEEKTDVEETGDIDEDVNDEDADEDVDGADDTDGADDADDADDTDDADEDATDTSDVDSTDEEEAVEVHSADVYLGGAVADIDVAKIGDTGYATLAAAFAAATTGNTTITLLKDITLDAGISAPQNLNGLVLDGDGHKITVNDSDMEVLVFTESKNITVRNLTITGTAKRAIVLNKCYNSTLENVTATGTYQDWYGVKMAVYFHYYGGGMMKNCDVAGVFKNSWVEHDGTDCKLVLVDTKIGTLFVNSDSATSTIITGKTVLLGEGNNSTSIDTLICGDASTFRVEDAVVENTTTVQLDFDNYVESESPLHTPVAELNGVQYATLADAIAAANEAGGSTTITVLKDCDFVNRDESGTLEASKVKSTIVLDLNGYVVTAKCVDGTDRTDSPVGIWVTSGDLTIMDSSEAKTGKLHAGNGTAGNAVVVTGGKFTLESGTLESNNNGICVQSTTKDAPAVIDIKGGTVSASTGTASSAAMYLMTAVNVTISGGELTGQYGIKHWGDLTLNISGGTLTATNGAAILGNGSANLTATPVYAYITISGGTVQSTASDTVKDAVGIYFPQLGKLKITGGTVSGATGIIFKAGELEISGGAISGTGSGNDYTSTGSSDTVCTGDGLLVENFGGGFGMPTVSITGGTFTSANAGGVASKANADNGMSAVTGFISGGVFAPEPVVAWVADGYQALELADGRYGVAQVTDSTPIIEYDEITLNAWSRKGEKWNEQTGTSENVDAYGLEGVKFGVYSGENLIKELTTGADGNVKLNAKDLNLDAAKAVYIIRQISAPSTENGERPKIWESWDLTAKRVVENGKIKVELSFDDCFAENADLYNGSWDGKTKTLEVYNPFYSSVKFTLEKTVSVKNKGVQPGENTFDFLIAPCYPEQEIGKLSFTPKGGKTVYPVGETMENGLTLYKVSLTVDGEATAEGVVTIEGWEFDLHDGCCVFELGEDSDSWEYADYYYELDIPSHLDAEGYWCYDLYDGVELEACIIQQLDQAPVGSENTAKGNHYSPDGEYGDEWFYYGYNGKWYEDKMEDADKVSFVNTYTAAAPPAPTATPAATAKQSPKTGDEANVALWLVLATVSAMGIAMVAGKKKVR